MAEPDREPDDPHAREREQLATMLALMLLITVGGSFVLFLIFVSMGLFFWVLVMSAVIAAFSGLHYVAWGRPTPRPPQSEADQDQTPVQNDWPAQLLDRHKRRRP